MTDPNADSRYQVVWLIRRLFRVMGSVADDYLRDDELTAAHRAVMEFLYPDEHLSVPAIAGKYRVSRQHVQVTANELRAAGLIEALPNPQHKRSPLMHLSELGRATFEAIRRKEAALIEKVFAGLDEKDIDTTRCALRTLLNQFEKGNLS
jgi:DNA-binding MarR family transcriptional regulator